MTIVARFRVATRATGPRRQVYVHVYDDREQLARAHNAMRGRGYEPERDGDIAGGVSTSLSNGKPGFWWPDTPVDHAVNVMRLWTEQLTTRTISHEAVHAAATMCFMDTMRGWNSRLRTFLIGDNEPMAYAVGDITADVIRELYRLKLLPN